MGFMAVYKVRGSGLTNKTTVDVLEALAFFLNEKTGACFPSTESIAKIARVHPNVARKTLKELEDSGFISSSQKAGFKRYFTLHLDRLPPQESTGGEELTGVKEVEPLKEVEWVKEVEPFPLKKVNPSPLTSLSTPLKEVEGELGNNKESNKVSNKVYDAPASLDLFPDATEMIEEKKPKKLTTKKGSRLTIEVLPDDWRKYCEEHAPDLDPEKAFEDFHDYWVGVPGAKGVKLDWFATWRNFLRGIPDWKRKNFVKSTKPTGRMDTTSAEYLEIYRRGCTYDPNAEPSPTDADGFVAF